MNIAFLPEDRRRIKGVRINPNIKNLNEDSLWIASIIEDVPPDYNAYLYLENPGTSYSIIHKLEDNWEKNIEENIQKAFRREFETLKEKGIEIGNYENLLVNINFTTIPEQHLNTVEKFKRSKNNFTQLYYSEFIPREYFDIDYAIEKMNIMVNSQERKPPLISPLDKLTNMLTKYRGPSQKRDVKFEENEEALELPENTQLVSNNGPWDSRRKVIAFDTSAIVLKEPLSVTRPKFDKLNEKLSKLIEQSNVIPSLKRRNKKKIDKLIKETNKLFDYNQSPFSGEYLDLEVPEELPENPVFEFLITLDTGSYMATRRVAVPGDMLFTDFDKLLLHLYRWTGFPYHLSEFIFPLKDEPESKEASEILVWQNEDMPEELYLRPVDQTYLLMNNPFDGVPTKGIKGEVLKDYFPEFRTAQYRYDFGDNWFHSIELVDIHDRDEYDKPLPYLIDSVGVAPMEDMGGTYAFERFMDADFGFFEEENFKKVAENWNVERELILKAPSSLAPLFEDDDLEE